METAMVDAKTYNKMKHSCSQYTGWHEVKIWKQDPSCEKCVQKQLRRDAARDANETYIRRSPRRNTLSERDGDFS